MSIVRPFIFRCKLCGHQWLEPRSCCERECAPAPLRTYVTTDSIHVADRVRFSVVLPVGHNATSLRQTVSAWHKQLAGESLEFILVARSLSEKTLKLIQQVAGSCNVRLLSIPARVSLGHGYNLGAQAARGRFLALAQDLVSQLPQGILEALYAALVDTRVAISLNLGNIDRNLVHLGLFAPTFDLFHLLRAHSSFLARESFCLRSLLRSFLSFWHDWLDSFCFSEIKTNYFHSREFPVEILFQNQPACGLAPRPL
jgi:hypothetical protein